MNFLVTGGAGFIGSTMCKALLDTFPTCHVVNLDKLDYCSSLKSIKELSSHPNYSFVKGDILSTDLVLSVLKSHQVSIIIHFAAQTHVDASFTNSILFTQTNVLGTHCLLECAKIHGVQKFIHLSTDEVYGESCVNEEADEKTVLEPTNPYAATKASAEHLVKSYYRSFKLPIMIVRLGNIYGPGQYPEKVIPRFITNLIDGKPCLIQGNGLVTRSFLFIGDLIRALLLILQKGIEGHVYNVGTQFEISILELAKKLVQKFGHSDNEFIQFTDDRPFNDVRYSLETRKINSLGWSPQVEFEEGLELTISWYKQNKNHWKIE